MCTFVHLYGFVLQELRLCLGVWIKLFGVSGSFTIQLVATSVVSCLLLLSTSQHSLNKQH